MLYTTVSYIQRRVSCRPACAQVDAGEVLEQALRTLPDIRSLILPLGFGDLDVRAFRSGAVSGGSVAAEQRAVETLAGVVEAGGGVDVYRVEGTGVNSGVTRKPPQQ